MRTFDGDKCDRKKQYVLLSEVEPRLRELERIKAEKAATGKQTTEDLVDIAMAVHGVLHGFVHEVWSNDIVKVAKDGGSTKPEGMRRRHEFRVGLYVKDKPYYYESTQPNMRQAIMECLEALKLPIPDLL